VANYPSDFQGAQTAYEAVEPTVFLGVEPLLIGLVLLALLLVGYLAYRQGLKAGEGSTDSDAPAAIHAALLAASQAAMSADSNSLKSKAVALRNRIQELLGPVLVVSKGLGKAVDLLDKAIEGKVKEEAKPDPAKPAVPAGTASTTPVCTCGHDAKPGACTCGAAPAAAAASALAFNHVTVIGLTAPQGVQPVAPPSPPAPAAPPATKIRDMTGDEQTEALAKAVRAFHDHWAPEARKRIEELDAARKALSRKPPGTKLNAGHGSGSHI